MNRRSLSDQSLFTSPSTKKPVHPKLSRTYDRWTIFCVVYGSLGILNGIWMLVAPEHWFYNLPFGVTESGPLNVHFVRDVGCIFFLLGCGLLIGGIFIEFRLPLFTMHTGFSILHMFVHIHEVVSGRLRMGIFWLDLPGIYIPALLSFALNIILIRKYMAPSKLQIRQTY